MLTKILEISLQVLTGEDNNLLLMMNAQKCGHTLTSQKCDYFNDLCLEI